VSILLERNNTAKG